MNIKTLSRSDYESWYPLWQENCLHQISDEVTQETWRRLMNENENVMGLGAYEEDNLCGFLHYVLHPTTGFIEPACYMQDLYVAESSRRQGIAKQLIWHLHELSKEHQWARLYWFADETNESVQNLYKNIGIRMNFSLHMLPTQE
ncbi:MAG: N-acetyltransferase [Pseudomonadota bacterium]